MSARILCRKVLVERLILRNFTLASCNSTKQRDGRFMSKLLGLSKSKRKFRVFGETSQVSLIDQVSHNAPKRGLTRRQNCLNKLFMKNITDLTISGNLNFDLVENGIEITKVLVSPDYTMINIYYVTNKEVEDLENKLQETHFALRHELAQLKLMGEVPKLQFVKDKETSKLSAVDRLLDNADLGVDEDFYEQDDPVDESLPPMENNACGLDYDRIMNKIKEGKKRASASHRNAPKIDPNVQDQPEIPLNNKQLISNFIISRKHS